MVAQNTGQQISIIASALSGTRRAEIAIWYPYNTFIKSVLLKQINNSLGIPEGVLILTETF